MRTDPTTAGTRRSGGTRRSRGTRRSPAELKRAIGLGVASAAVFGALCAAPGAAWADTFVPEGYGPFAVHSTSVRIPVPIDPRGPEGAFTPLAAEVYVPDARGKLPVVQISHAWPGTLREFPLSGWAKRLASRGFVVIVSDRRGGSASVAPSLDQAFDLIDLSSDVNSEDILRVLRWAIAQGEAPGSALYRKVDARRLAIAGHSLGGYFATFAAVKAQTEGPALSALVLLDPTDERLGNNTINSSLTAAPSVTIPTIVEASEANQHPVMCDMSQGVDCTIVSAQEYQALTGARARLGLKVVGSVHEDVEDPATTTSDPVHLQMFQRYGMAWLEFWAAGDCRAAPFLGGPAALIDQSAARITLYQGGTPAPKRRRCRIRTRVGG